MIDYIDFTDRYYPSANQARKDDIKRFLDNLNELVGDTSLAEAINNKQLLCRSFYLQKAGNSVSRPHYQKIKEYLINLFDYLGVKGVVPTREEVIDSKESIGYFRSILKLLEFIDNVGESILPQYNPTRDLVRVKAICILGWIGFSLDDISNLKKRDLIPIDNIGFKIVRGDEEYEIIGEPFSVLFYLLDLYEYNGLPSGRKIILKGGEDYLFRPVDTNCDKLDSGQIIQIIKRFNACIPQYKNTSIVFRNLHKNALFLEIYNSKPNPTNLIATIMKVMRCTNNYALNYKEQYLKFAAALEAGKI